MPTISEEQGQGCSHASHTGGLQPTLINLALDGITNFSSLPLRLATFLGFALAFTSLIFATVIVFLKLNN